MRLTVSLALALHFLFVCSAASQETPRFAGVYLEMADGDFVEIPAIQPLSYAFQNIIVNSDPNLTILREGPFPSGNFISVEDVLQAPVVRHDQIEAIFTQLRNEELQFVTFVGVSGAYFAGYEPRDQSVRTQTVWADDLVLSHWGWTADNYDIELIDLFNTRYSASSLVYNHRTNGSPIFQSEDTGARTPLYGFVVQTNQQNYHLFFTLSSIGPLAYGPTPIDPQIREHFRAVLNTAEATGETDLDVYAPTPSVMLLAITSHWTTTEDISEALPQATRCRITVESEIDQFTGRPAQRVAARCYAQAPREVVEGLETSLRTATFRAISEVYGSLTRTQEVNFSMLVDVEQTLHLVGNE